MTARLRALSYVRLSGVAPMFDLLERVVERLWFGHPGPSSGLRKG
jgi:hypothetical protein